MTPGPKSDVPQSDAREVLQRRARDLARPVAGNGETQGDCLRVVEFRLANERYAVEEIVVREVAPLRDLTPLPAVPDFIAGIVNVRGQLLTVIDIRSFLELPNTGVTDHHSIVVIQSQDMELGILADRVAGTRAIALNDIQTTLPMLSGIQLAYVKGLTSEIIILDVFRILADPKIIVCQEPALS